MTIELEFHRPVQMQKRLRVRITKKTSPPLFPKGLINQYISNKSLEDETPIHHIPSHPYHPVLSVPSMPSHLPLPLPLSS